MHARIIYIASLGACSSSKVAASYSIASSFSLPLSICMSECSAGPGTIFTHVNKGIYMVHSERKIWAGTYDRSVACMQTLASYRAMHSFFTAGQRRASRPPAQQQPHHHHRRPARSIRAGLLLLINPTSLVHPRASDLLLAAVPVALVNFNEMQWTMDNGPVSGQ